MEFKEEWLEEDRKSGESKELRTAKEVIKIYNSIMPEVRCTAELAEEFGDNRLPTLDT